MASLRYRIRGFGIRGFYYTKDDWEVKKNVYMTVKQSDGGSLSVYTDEDVCAGNIPQELQVVLRMFLQSKPSSVIKVKVTSVKPVYSVDNKGQEIPCDIELIYEDVTAVRNAINAIQEDIKKLQKKMKQISMWKMSPYIKITDKKADDERPEQNAVADKGCAKSDGVKEGSKKKNLKRTFDNNSMTDVSGSKIRKTTAASIKITDNKADDKRPERNAVADKGCAKSDGVKEESKKKNRKRTSDNNSMTGVSGSKIRKITEASTSTAQTQPAPTDKKKKIFRYQYLLIEIGAEVLRMLFDQRVKNDFMQYLNANPSQYKQLKFLMNKNIINDSQQQLLPPLDNKPSSSKFDITLLACLLKNVCGLCQRKDQVWDSPDPTDLSVEADITRLRKCRNNLAHSATVFISETNSTSKWNELNMILNRLGNKCGNANLLSKISAAHNMDIDEEMKSHYDETLKLWEEMDQLFDHGVEKMKQTLDSIKNVQAEMQVDISEIKKHLKKSDTVNQRRNQLCKEDCSKLSKHIGSNWQFLGYELGITQVQIDHIMEDSRTTRGSIVQMLSLWMDVQGQHATIDKFITAMEACVGVVIEKPDIYIYFEELKKKHH